MSRFTFKLPDLGEGTVDAEIVAWRVSAGDEVVEDQPLVEMMTEKATVEVPAPVSGRVLSLTGAPGDRIAVGAELAAFETAATAPSPSAAAPASPGAATSAGGGAQAARPAPTPAAQPRAGRVLTSPAIRRRAHEAGIDLAQVAGSGPNGRIRPADLRAYLAQDRPPARSPARASSTPVPAGNGAAAGSAATEEIRVIGMRRLIAERMSEAARSIPHFAYVEEVDVTELERLRAYLNRERPARSLTYLPFLVLALTRTLRAHPQCNARYDAERGVIVRHRAVHVGIATQTPDGLKVPVVRDAQDKSLQALAEEIRRVSEAARSNQASRAELSGSTITVTSLGKLGGIASTPIINAPELAIIGVNRALERPVVLDGQITVRRLMNLSSSFDHRFIDGHDAAAMIQTLKGYLEHPATIFLPD
ncbi:MAG TPA: dihydrolipoamide acetyltransferase family protein [Steroidobacteraceae bacterium]|nr:dihydrolipoamide acetyltransferase family protein [Steroidobacteraceae bacterium]